MRSNKLLLPLIVVSAAIGAYWFLLLAPKREEAATLTVKVTQKQGEIQQAETVLAGYRSAQKTFKVNYATVARLGKAVPVDDDVRSLVVQLEHAADASKVDFRSINVGGSTGAASAASPTTATTGQAPPPGAEPVGAAGFSVMPFTLQFDGKYMNLSSFFSRMQRFVNVSNEKVDVTGRLLRVENFTLVPGEYPQLSASLGASSYLVPSTQGLTGGATTQGPGTATPAKSTDSGSTPVPTTATSTGALR